MNGPFQFETVETSEQMLAKLYGRDDPTCLIVVPLPDTDEVHELPLIVSPVSGNDDEVYEIVGGDRAYRTTARLTSAGDSFAVDVVVRYYDHEMRPATLFVSPEVDRIIKENRY